MSDNKTDFATLLAKTETLSEQFKSEAIDIFNRAVESRATELSEAAVNQQVEHRIEQERKQIADQLAEQYEQLANQHAEDRLSELREQVTKEITEQYAEKYQSLIEANDKLTEQVNTLEQQRNDQIEYAAAELAADKVSELRDRLASYADYVAEQYVDQHEEQTISEAQYTIANSLMESIRTTLQSYGLSAPEATKALEDQCAELAKQRDDAYAELAEAVEAKYQLTRKLDKLDKDAILESATAKLTEADAARVRRLMEGDDSSIDRFKSRVTTLVESFDNSAKHDQTKLDVGSDNVVSGKAVIVEHVDDEKKSADVAMTDEDREVAMIVEALKRHGDKY